MNINIQTIAHKYQRYPTWGDWWFDINGDLQIRVSNFNDPDAEALIALHELVEVILCKKRGISQESVDKFDIDYVKENGMEGEPGDDPKAPYRKEHFFATNIERLMAEQLEFDWANWDKEPV
jgi:hypothetical protein